jgi:ABC-2 type transport system permease protein
VLGDIVTIVWKESKEFLQGSSKASGISRLVFPIVLAGVLMPWRFGRAYVTGGAAFLGLVWILPMIAVSLTVDAIAGERERHTLESLLATRLSDAAILFGKIIASVLYAWGMMIVSLMLGVITVNLTRRGGPLLLFSPASAAALVVFSLLASTLACSVAVLVSVGAATVRQAAQTFGYGFTAIVFATIFGFQSLPVRWRITLVERLSTEHVLQTALIAGLVLLAMDIVVLAVAWNRFQRARLILD